MGWFSKDRDDDAARSCDGCDKPIDYSQPFTITHLVAEQRDRRGRTVIDDVAEPEYRHLRCQPGAQGGGR